MKKKTIEKQCRKGLCGIVDKGRILKMDSVIEKFFSR